MHTQHGRKGGRPEAISHVGWKLYVGRGEGGFIRRMCVYGLDGRLSLVALRGAERHSTSRLVAIGCYMCIHVSGVLSVNILTYLLWLSLWPADPLYGKTHWFYFQRFHFQRYHFQRCHVQRYHLSLFSPLKGG